MPITFSTASWLTVICRYIEPSLAKKVAEGDACPVTLHAMEDINPTFVPRALKQIPLNNMSSDTKRKGKEKMTVPEKARSATILTFFSEIPLLSLAPAF